MLKIAYLGNFRPIHSTETHVAKTLRAMGHEVIELQEDTYNADRLYIDVVGHKPDLFLWTRTWNIMGSMGLALVKLKDHGIPTVSFHLDLYWGISRERSISTDPFWKTEYVFTPDGGHEKEFKEAGVNHFYLKPGVFDQECYMGNPKQRESYNVAFVGSERYHPEWPYRPQLVQWLRSTYGEEFGKFGEPGNQAQLRRNQDLNNLYASARIIVGDSLCVGFNHPYYWSDRVYETLGRGGFLIHPYIKGMDEEFKDGVHLAYYKFGDFNQLQQKIDYYLQHPLERETIRQAGHEFVKANATYKHRMHEMLSTLSKQGAIK